MKLIPKHQNPTSQGIVLIKDYQPKQYFFNQDNRSKPERDRSHEQAKEHERKKQQAKLYDNAPLSFLTGPATEQNMEFINTANSTIPMMAASEVLPYAFAGSMIGTGVYDATKNGLNFDNGLKIGLGALPFLNKNTKGFVQHLKDSTPKGQIIMELQDAVKNTKLPIKQTSETKSIERIGDLEITPDNYYHQSANAIDEFYTYPDVVDRWFSKGKLFYGKNQDKVIETSKANKLTEQSNKEFKQTSPLSEKDVKLYRYNPNYGFEKVKYDPNKIINWDNAVSNINYSKQVQNFIDNDIIPRLQAQGHKTKKYVPVFREIDPKNDAYDAKYGIHSNAGAWFIPVTNDITLRGSLSKQDYGLTLHEAGGHGLRYNIQPNYRPTTRYYFNKYIEGNSDLPQIKEELLKTHAGKEQFTPTEISILNETYPWVNRYFERNPGNSNSVLHEQGAINTQFRAQLSDNGKIVGKELDKVIDTTPDEILLDKLRQQSYTNSITEDLANISGKSEDDIIFASLNELKELTKYPQVQDIVSRMRNAMKQVGIYSIPITIGGALYGTNN